MTRVLFTGGGGAGCEALWRLLKDKYDLHFADADIKAIDPGIPAKRRHAIPMAAETSFAARLCELADKLRIDLVVPGVDEELLHVAELAERGWVRALLPPRHFIERNLDKLACAQFLATHGSAAPQTLSAERAHEIGFPCIVKPRRGRGSRGVAVIETREQASAYLAYRAAPAGSFIVQEYARGQEFTVMMAADGEGSLRGVVPVAVELKRGVTIRGSTREDAEVHAACAEIHATDPVPGCYNIQLIRCDDGRVLVFEINPRVSTTLCLGVAAGLDPIAIFLGGGDGAASALMAYRAGLSLRRNWTNHFIENAHG